MSHSIVVIIMWASISFLVNIGIVVYFIKLSKAKSDNIFEYLKLRYPDKVKELLGNDGNTEKIQSNDARIKIGKFIRNNDSIQDVEYVQLRKEFLFNSKVFMLTLTIVYLIQFLCAWPIFSFYYQRLVGIVVPCSLPALFWLVYQLYEWNKAPNPNLVPGDKRNEIKNGNKNIIKFELARISKNIYKNYPIIGTLGVALIFVIFVICALSNKANGWSYLLSQLQGLLIFCGIFYLIVLGGVYRTWRARMAYELSFDQEKKEFSVLIINRKEVVKFMVKDIKEVGKDPTQGGFRFYLNDGTWVTWDSAFTNKEQDLENLVRLLGISIRIQSFW